MKGLIFAAAIAAVAVMAFAATASASDWTLSLTASPSPVAAGTDATFSGTLLNPSATQGVPNKPVVVRAYGTDSTCTGAYAEIGPVVTSGDKGDKGYYTVDSMVPANAHDGTTYYVKAFSIFDDLMVESGCIGVTVTHADAWSIDLSIAPSKVVGSQPVTFSGTLSNLGPTSESEQPVTVNAYWTNSTCDGTPSYYFYGTTGAGGAYSIGPITTGAPAGDYYYTASSNGAVSDCQHFTIGWDADGSIDSASTTGTTVTLPVEGHYKIDVSGTWDNGIWYGVDAEYVEQTLGGVWAQGWPGYPTVDFGDLQVNGQFVDWGAYDSAHTYSLMGSFAAGPLTLSVWDRWADLVTDGQSDNVGELDYTITYVGP